MIEQHGTLEISRSRLRHNVQALRRRAGKAKLCATIKANAYGHGVEAVSELLQAEGIEWACVYSLQEAVSLARSSGFKILALAPLVLPEPSPEFIGQLLDLGCAEVRFNVTDAHTARQLSKCACEGGKNWPVHMQVDLGLTRMGVDAADAESLAVLIAGLPGLSLEGVFGHFSHGDVPGHESVSRQAAVLQGVTSAVRSRLPGLKLIVHLQNSGGAFHVDADAYELDMVRVGIALYGLQPSTRDTVGGLLPVARVTAPVLAVHDRPAGTGVGYGHTFVTRRPTRLAIVPVGYADGYPRQISNRAVAQIRGRDVPVVGRVSMDQIILDVTDVPAAPVAVGEMITVISWDADKPNSLDRLADAIGTIGYELATHLGAGGGRLRRTIVE